MKRITNRLLPGLLSTIWATSVWAHPGHGVIPPDEPAHWLEPVHLLPVLGTAAAIVIAHRWLKSGDDHRTD